MAAEVFEKLLDEGRDEEALVQATMMAAVWKDPIQASVFQAKALQRLGEFDTAILFLDTAMELLQGSAPAEFEDLHSMRRLLLRQQQQQKHGDYPQLKPKFVINFVDKGLIRERHLIGVLQPQGKPEALADYVDPRVVFEARSLKVTAPVNAGELLFVLNPAAVYVKDHAAAGELEDEEAALVARAESSWRFAMTGSLSLNTGASIAWIMQCWEEQNGYGIEPCKAWVTTVHGHKGVWPLLGNLERSCSPNLAVTVVAGSSVLFLRASSGIPAGGTLVISDPEVDPAVPRRQRTESCYCDKCMVERRVEAYMEQEFERSLSLGLAASQLPGGQHMELVMDMLGLNHDDRMKVRCAYSGNYYVHYLGVSFLNREGAMIMPVPEPLLILQAVIRYGHGGFVQHWKKLLDLFRKCPPSSYARSQLEAAFTAWFGDESGPSMLEEALGLTRYD